MLKEGAFDDPVPDAVFGIHIGAALETGQLGYRPGPLMAATDVLRITVKGRQTHGASPWNGVDPIVVASQIVVSLQTIVSRQMNITREPVVLTIGGIDGGIRFNIIPDKVEMIGTIRTFDEGMRDDIHRRVKLMAESIAMASGASAEVSFEKTYPVTINNPELTERMLPTLKRVAGEANVILNSKVTGSEDFSFFAQRAPGLFVFLGGTPRGSDMKQIGFNHSPRFKIEESAMKLGVRTLLNLTVDYLEKR